MTAPTEGSALPTLTVLGLMSGTSLDGISAAVVRFASAERGAWSVERGVASEERGAGSGEQGAGSRGRGAGSGEQGAGSGEQGPGSSEQGAPPTTRSPRSPTAAPPIGRGTHHVPSALRTQHSALSTPPSALSTQHSALSTPPSALRTQHSARSTPPSALSTQHSALSAPISYELLGFRTHAYAPAQRDRLAAALTGGSAAEYCRLHVDLGHWLADAAVALAAESGVGLGELAAVATHGQTVWHEPGHSTWQIGDPAVIVERTGVAVVSDFRSRDIAAGGQGAPLVPIADRLLFAHATQWRALQNLGGIGNVGVVPPGGVAEGVRAFDTGPGVAVIDSVVRRVRPALPYDVDGRLARAGTAIDAVVDQLLAEPYFASPPPKSTGRELFSPAYVERMIDACRALRPACTDEDLVATAVALTALSIGDAYRRFVPEPVADVVLSGGGAKNPALVAAIERVLPGGRVVLFDDLFFDGEAKEAVAFALLGYLHLIGRPGNVPSATGAAGPRVLGSFTPA